MAYGVPMVHRNFRVAEVDDLRMQQLAAEYGCTVTTLYQRATSLYLLTHDRTMHVGEDVWPGGFDQEVTGDAEGP